MIASWLAARRGPLLVNRRQAHNNKFTALIILTFKGETPSTISLKYYC